MLGNKRRRWGRRNERRKGWRGRVGKKREAGGRLNSSRALTSHPRLDTVKTPGALARLSRVSVCLQVGS